MLIWFFGRISSWSKFIEISKCCFANFRASFVISQFAMIYGVFYKGSLFSIPKLRSTVFNQRKNFCHFDVVSSILNGINGLQSYNGPYIIVSWQYFRYLKVFSWFSREISNTQQQSEIAPSEIHNEFKRIQNNKKTSKYLSKMS